MEFSIGLWKRQAHTPPDRTNRRRSILRSQDGRPNKMFWVFISLGMIVICSLQATSAKNAPASAAEHYRLAGMHFQKREFDQAIMECQEATRLRPNFVEAYNLEGRALIVEERWEEAEATFKVALGHNPRYLEARSGLSFSYYHQQNNEMAEKAALAALALDPRDLLSNFVLGLISYSRRDLQAAVAYLGRAGGLPEGSSEAQFALARIYLYQHERQRGLEYVHRVSELRNLSAADQFELGRLYDEYGLYAEEAPIFSRLCNQFPTSFEAKYNLALATFHMDKVSDARNILQQMIAENPRAETYDLLAACDEALGDPAAAEQSYVKAIELDPLNEDYYLRGAELAMDRLAYDLGINILRVGLQRLPHSYRIWLLLGRIYDPYGKVSEAESSYREAVSLNPKYNVSWALLALFLARRERSAEALKAIQAGLTEIPKDFLLPYVHALMLSQTPEGNNPAMSKEIYALLKSSVAANPNFVESRYLLGQFYFNNGDFLISRRELEKAHELNPHHYATNLLLIRVYKKTNDLGKISKVNQLMEEGRTNQSLSRYASRLRDANQESILFWEIDQP